MEKINFKNFQNSEEYKKGQKEFAEGKVKNEGVKFAWYKAKVSTKKWNEHYSKVGYTFLGEDGNDTWVGFLSVIPPDGCLEITDVNDLMKIQRHREATKSYPQPMEVKE